MSSEVPNAAHPAKPSQRAAARGPFGIFRGTPKDRTGGVTQPRFSLVLLACGRLLATRARRLDCQVLAEELAPLEVAWTAAAPPTRDRAGDRDRPMAPPAPVLPAQIRALNPWGRCPALPSCLVRPALLGGAYFGWSHLSGLTPYRVHYNIRRARNLKCVM